MKTVLASLLALGLTVSATALAAEPLVTAGSIRGDAGWTLLHESNDEFFDETDDQSYLTLGLSGNISFPLAASFSAQLDALGQFYDTKEHFADRNDNLNSMIMGGGHLSWRNPDKGLIGIFGGTSRGRTARSFNKNHAAWSGVEGQFYLPDVTLYGQAGWAAGDVQGTEETFDDTYVFRAVARYFPADNQKIEVEASFTRSDDAIDAFDDVRAQSYGASYAFQFRDTPWHAHAGYRGTFIDTTTEGEKVDDHAIIVGVSYLFGARSLKHNDRYGATLDQPQIVGHTVNWIEALD